MEDEILKSRLILITVDKNIGFDDIFNSYKSEDRKVRIVPASIDGEMMEVFIRNVQKEVSFTGKTGKYIPPQKEEETKEKKKSIIKKISDNIIP